MDKKFRLGVIGGGNMASAILKGIVSKRLLLPHEILVSDCDFQKLANLSTSGFCTTITNEELLANCEVILIAVKPQNFRETLIDDLISCKAKFIISIMAGVTIRELFKVFKHRNIVRVMPNLPAVAGNGATALCFCDENTPYKTFVSAIFNSVGITVELSEDKFDAVTSVSGSGPAYVFYFLNSLIKGGVNGGLSYEVAKALAIQTFIGSAMLAESSESDLDQLIVNVSSKGGTTVEAISHFRDCNLEEIIIEGVDKCRERSCELSKYEDS